MYNSSWQKRYRHVIVLDRDSCQFWVQVLAFFFKKKTHNHYQTLCYPSHRTSVYINTFPSPIIGPDLYHSYNTQVSFTSSFWALIIIISALVLGGEMKTQNRNQPESPAWVARHLNERGWHWTNMSWTKAWMLQVIYRILIGESSKHYSNRCGSIHNSTQTTTKLQIHTSGIFAHLEVGSWVEQLTTKWKQYLFQIRL